jgi:hypothetical protein
MFIFLRGNRNARIKTYTDHEHQCSDCKDFDLQVKVYKDYYHFMFIPIFPNGVKTVKIHCKKCGEPYRSDSLQKQYELRTRNPFWLYSGIILVGLIGLGAVAAVYTNDYLTTRFVEAPRPGDVFRIHDKQRTTSAFAKVTRVAGDTIYFFDNRVDYFGDPSKMDSADFFVADKEVPMTRQDLKDMLHNAIITDVFRHYDEEAGFGRVRLVDSSAAK